MLAAFVVALPASSFFWKMMGTKVEPPALFVAWRIQQNGNQNVPC
jgi:hypothetical protein